VEDPINADHAAIASRDTVYSSPQRELAIFIMSTLCETLSTSLDDKVLDGAAQDPVAR